MEYQKTLTLTGYGQNPSKSYDDKITKFSRSSPQNNSETITNEYDKEIPKERYISPEERQKIINDPTFNIIVQ